MVEKWSRKGLRIGFRAHPAIRRLSVVSWALPGRLLEGSWADFGAPGGSLGPVLFFFHGLLGASWGRPAAVLDPLGPSPDRFGEVLEALGARRRRQKQMAGRNEKCTFYYCKTNDFEDEGSLRESLGALFGAFFGRPGAL